MSELDPRALAGGLASHEAAVVLVEGPDARSFVDGQCSQQVADLAVGTGRPALLLEPEGKVVALCWIAAVGEESIAVGVDAGALEATMARLRRFNFRVKCTMSVLDWSARVGWGTEPPEGEWALARSDRAGSPWWWIAGAPGSLPAASVPPPDAETIRVLRGWPRFGAEITAGTIPASLGAATLATTVSFTKGCYPGQELVARLDARGAEPPFTLRLLRSATPLSVGQALLDAAGIERGQVTSPAPCTEQGAYVALAMVHRSMEVGTVAQVATVDAAVGSILA